VNYFPVLALNRDPPDLSLPSSRDYVWEPLYSPSYPLIFLCILKSDIWAAVQ
jgi:hypothetical protein